MSYGRGNYPRVESPFLQVKTCCLCERPALFIANEKGFCRTHKKEATALQTKWHIGICIKTEANKKSSAYVERAEAGKMRDLHTKKSRTGRVRIAR